MEAHFNLANCLQVKGDIEGAIAEYQAVLQKYPGSAAVHNNLGSLYVTMNKRDKAANEFSQALQIDPSQTISYFNLAKSLQAIGHRPQAMDNYSQFVIKAQTNTQLSTAVNESRKQMRLLKAAIDRSASS
jgi:tetratricopeptide (TPR) repeat protein